jgi:hypothetical protein
VSLKRSSSSILTWITQVGNVLLLHSLAQYSVSLSLSRSNLATLDLSNCGRRNLSQYASVSLTHSCVDPCVATRGQPSTEIVSLFEEVRVEFASLTSLVVGEVMLYFFCACSAAHEYLFPLSLQYILTSIHSLLMRFSVTWLGSGGCSSGHGPSRDESMIAEN